MRLTRRLFVLLGACAASVAIAACGGSDEPSDDYIRSYEDGAAKACFDTGHGSTEFDCGEETDPLIEPDYVPDGDEAPHDYGYVDACESFYEDQCPASELKRAKHDIEKARAGELYSSGQASEDDEGTDLKKLGLYALIALGPIVLFSFLFGLRDL